MTDEQRARAAGELLDLAQAIMSGDILACRVTCLWPSGDETKVSIPAAGEPEDPRLPVMRQMGKLRLAQSRLERPVRAS